MASKKRDCKRKEIKLRHGGAGKEPVVEVKKKEKVGSDK